MYSIHLNLLSPEKRSYLKHLIYAQFIKNTLESLLVILSLAGIVLLGGLSVLQNHFNSLAASIASTYAQQNPKSKYYQKVNADLIQIEALQKNYVQWSPLLTGLANAIPAQITLQSMEISPTDKTLSLTGLAPARDDLLALQKKLEALDGVVSVSVPPSELTTKDNLAFSITVKLK